MNDICIIYTDKEPLMPIMRVVKAVNHPLIPTIPYIPYSKGLKPNFKVIILVGTDVIKNYLKKPTGRFSAVKIDQTWYLTLPSISALHIESVAIAAAHQIIRAIRIIQEPDYCHPKVQYHTVQNTNELRFLVQEASKSVALSFDFETNNELQVHSPTFRATCLGITYTPNFTWIITEEQLYDPEYIKILNDIFTLKNTVKIAHNLSFDYKILKKLGIKVDGQYACTKIMSFLVDENYSNGLKEFVDRYLPEFSGYDYHIDFNTENKNDLYSYLAIDCHTTLIAYFIFLKEIVADDKLYVTFRNIYMSGLFVLADMEYSGADVDTDYLDEKIEYITKVIEEEDKAFQDLPEVQSFIIKRNKKLVSKAIQELEGKIATRSLKFTSPTDKFINDWRQQIQNFKTGASYIIDSCNIGSPKELAELLYSEDGMGLPRPLVESRDSKGKKVMVESNSTDKEALNDIDHPIANKIRVIRSYEQMLGTFYKSIREKVIDGKIYASFNQTGAKTCRLSSNSPNLQNLPTRVHLDDDRLKEVVKGVKKAFIAPSKDHVVMQADLSQAELRMIAHFSKDENMIEAYKKGIDLHAITGSKIAKMELEDFLMSHDFKKFRQSAKSANFGLVYDISPDGYIAYVKSQTGEKITPATEKIHRASVFGAYPKLLDWHNESERLVRHQGYVTTIFGTKRRLPEIYSNNRAKISEAIRFAINNPIQGSIGLYAIWVMVWLKHRLPSYGWGYITTVHDSIVIWCHKDLVDTCKEVISEMAETIPWERYFDIEKLVVPLPMDIEIGPSYGELSEI